MITEKNKSMKNRILRKILRGFMCLLAAFIIIMLIPRAISLVVPSAKPLGYHFIALDYLAAFTRLERIIDRQPTVPDEIEAIKNIEYKNIDGKSLQLDIYRPKNIEKPLPLLVFIHGGGWRGGERGDYLPYLIPFALEGYVTATVSYRLIADGPYPACAEDITDALGWFYRNGTNYGYNHDRIALIGGSAGAHLAMLAAYGWGNLHRYNDSSVIAEENHVKVVVEIYGPVDLTTPYARNHILVTDFLATSYTGNPGRFSDASPINYIDKDDPPTLILHGTSDNLVPVSQADLLKHKLDSLGVAAEIHKLPLWPHTMDIIKRVNDYSFRTMKEFLKKYL